MAIEMHSALLAVDVQPDFMPGGALAIAEGDLVVPALNAYIELFEQAGLPVIASRDWHPPETTHFNTRGGPWPPHCVQGTPGAQIHRDLMLPPGALMLSKGMDPGEDGYSAFLARDEAGTLLGEHLVRLGVRHVYVGGLALDYCVLNTAIDARRRHLRVTILIDATLAVNVKPHDGERAIEQMVRSGVSLATIEWLRRPSTD